MSRNCNWCGNEDALLHQIRDTSEPANSGMDSPWVCFTCICQRWLGLQNECDRYKEALEKIANDKAEWMQPCNDDSDWVFELQELARKALEKEDDR